MTIEAYCEPEDLLLTGVPIPSNAQQYVDNAAEEIDSRIGFKYATPVVVGNSPEERPTRLLLKRLNIFLATGRLLMAADAAGQDDQLHQYALYLVQQAEEVLIAISDGSVILPGASPATEDTEIISAPQVNNVDAFSYVEEFKGVFGDPMTVALERPSAFPFGNPYTW